MPHTPPAPARRGRLPRSALAAAALSALLAAACKLEPTAQARRAPLGPPDDAATAVGPSGLVQTLRLSDAHLTRGDRVTIVSVITNRGEHAVTVTARMCGFDLQGSEGALAHPRDLGRCAGYSINGFALAPGDSLREVEIRDVRGAPGEHTVRVRHLLDPELWVPLTIVIYQN